ELALVFHFLLRLGLRRRRGRLRLGRLSKAQQRHNPKSRKNRHPRKSLPKLLHLPPPACFRLAYFSSCGLTEPYPLHQGAAPPTHGWVLAEYSRTTLVV